MKNLFYKEFKLCMHPLIWTFIFCSPLMVLIPSYPVAVSMIYICTCYPIIFLGANKGQQSNDIFYSCLLPIRKKDVVKARMLLLLFIQAVSLFLIIIVGMVKAKLGLKPEGSVDAGFSPNAVISVVAFGVVGFSLYDFIYLTSFYKNGRRIVASSLISMFVFAVYIMLFTVILPETFEWFKTFFTCSYLKQLIFLGISVLIYVALHIITLNISAERLNKVDL